MNSIKELQGKCNAWRELNHELDTMMSEIRRIERRETHLHHREHDLWTMRRRAGCRGRERVDAAIRRCKVLRRRCGPQIIALCHKAKDLKVEFDRREIE